MFSNKIVILLSVCTFITLDMESRCGWRYILYHKYVYFSILQLESPANIKQRRVPEVLSAGVEQGGLKDFTIFTLLVLPLHYLASIHQNKIPGWITTRNLSCCPVQRLVLSTSTPVYHLSCLPSVLSTSCPAQMNYLRVMNNVLGVF